MDDKAPRIFLDDTHPAMFRIEWPDGQISGMANLARCRDAVRCFIDTDQTKRSRAKRAARGREACALAL